MKKAIRIFACVLAVVSLLTSVMLCAGCSASFYSEKQHIRRVKKRAEKRYLSEGSEYTGLEVYPLYNEHDELKYMLIELEPQGFVYVVIHEKAYPWRSMYTRSSTKVEWWMPYRVKEGAMEKVIGGDGRVHQDGNREYFRDQNGQAIIYHQSHFKVAGIENERRYILEIVPTVDLGFSYGRIPAVKRGEKYLNLVDGSLIDYEPGMEAAYAVAGITFINKSHFNL